MAPLAWGSWESLGLLGRLVAYFRFRGFVVIKVEWSGVEWSGVEWSGVEWSGVEWGGVGWGGVGWGGVGWSGMRWSGVEWSRVETYICNVICRSFLGGSIRTHLHLRCYFQVCSTHPVCGVIILTPVSSENSQF